MTRDLRLERVYPHPPERVWRVLTDPRRVSEWLMQTDFEPVLGREFTFRGKPRPGWDGITYCAVTELEPPRRLAYSWRGGPGGGAPHSLDTIVRWTLSPEGTGTHLVLEHTGFSGLRAVLVSYMMSAGWQRMMRTRLEAAIAAAP